MIHRIIAKNFFFKLKNSYKFVLGGLNLPNNVMCVATSKRDYLKVKRTLKVLVLNKFEIVEFDQLILFFFLLKNRSIEFYDS